jgi:DNA-binding response OmpR family regulator
MRRPPETERTMTKHILAVDDEPAVRDLICEALTMAGFRVTGASNASEAMQVLLGDPPDLIITDLQLEEGDGFDLVDRVKAAAPKTPIILLTGVLFDEEIVRGPVWEKIAAYVQKTSSLEHIVRTVKQHVPA